MDTQTNYQIFIPLSKGIYSFRNIMTKTIRAFTQAGSKCSKPTLSSDIRYSVVSKRLVLYQSISSTGKYSRGTKYQLLGDDIPPSRLSVVGLPVLWMLHGRLPTLLPRILETCTPGLGSKEITNAIVLTLQQQLLLYSFVARR
jgi:hypothetical protein